MYKTKSNKCKKIQKTLIQKFWVLVMVKIMILPKRAICGSKKSQFIKNHKVKGLLSKLTIRTPLGEIPLLDIILF